MKKEIKFIIKCKAKYLLDILDTYSCLNNKIKGGE